ncbi:MAG: hypothetical protein JWQ10_3723 [Herbaspirillum sp.]|nr:hypothetical protein [Herbaspirillum sp.]
MTIPVKLGAPVPARYRGVWQRSLLETPRMRDIDTTVFWLQTGRWHADIRIPAGRPDFSGVYAFADCNEQQLDWLVRQHGFAGVTQVDAARSHEICRWRHLLDYHPARAKPDAGLMHFEPAFLTETGLYTPYLEHWHLLPDSHDGFAALQLLNVDGAPATPARFLLVAGSYVMHIKNRCVDWPAGMTPGTLLTARVASEHMALLDFEISFGCRTADGWDILHSTLPWRAGQPVSVRLGSVREDCVDLTIDGVSQRWKILEWSAPLVRSGRRAGCGGMLCAVK